jgi:hypothetical protein
VARAVVVAVVMAVVMVVVTLVVAMVPRGVIRAVTGLRDAGATHHDCPSGAKQCDCACDSLAHLNAPFRSGAIQGAAERVAPSRGHWS